MAARVRAKLAQIEMVLGVSRISDPSQSLSCVQNTHSRNPSPWGNWVVLVTRKPHLPSEYADSIGARRTLSPRTQM